MSISSVQASEVQKVQDKTTKKTTSEKTTQKAPKTVGKSGDSVEIKQTPEQKESMGVIIKARQYGYGEFYRFDADKDGDFIVSIKEEMQLGKIKKQLGIKDGVIAEYNEDVLKKSRKPLISVHSSETKYNDDNLIAPKGTKFFFPKGSLNPKDPEDTIWNSIKKLFE